MEMLVGEQKQDGVALLLDPAGRRSLISPFRSSRKCRMCVEAEAVVGDRRAFRARGPQGSIQMEMLVGEQRQDGVALLLDPAGRRSLISPFSDQQKAPDVRGSGKLIRASPESTQGLLGDAEPEDGDGARPRAADRFQVDPGEARG